MARRPGFGRDGGNIQKAAESAVSANLGQILSLKQEAKYMTGARTVIKINGKLVGFAFQVSWNINTEQTEIYTIDDPLPYEIAPKRVSVSGSLGCLMIPGRSPTAERMQSNMLSFLLNKYITIEVRDSVTDEILFKTNQAVITNNSTILSAEQIGQIQLTWKAVGWLSEQAPEPPKDADKKYDEAQKTKGSFIKPKLPLPF